ncbi:unnamed protein product [Closterium sp. Naga37s-1]|nr:unnamed protein product [Closterium sp. Naga37s-1]
MARSLSAIALVAGLLVLLGTPLSLLGTPLSLLGTPLSLLGTPLSLASNSLSPAPFTCSITFMPCLLLWLQSATALCLALSPLLPSPWDMSSFAPCLSRILSANRIVASPFPRPALRPIICSSAATQAEAREIVVGGNKGWAFGVSGWKPTPAARAGDVLGACPSHAMCLVRAPHMRCARCVPLTCDVLGACPSHAMCLVRAPHMRCAWCVPLTCDVLGPCPSHAMCLVRAPHMRCAWCVPLTCATTALLAPPLAEIPSLLVAYPVLLLYALP